MWRSFSKVKYVRTFESTVKYVRTFESTRLPNGMTSEKGTFNGTRLPRSRMTSEIGDLDYEIGDLDCEAANINGKYATNATNNGNNNE